MNKDKNLENVKVSERYKNKYKLVEKDMFTTIPPIPGGGMIIEVTNRCNHNCIFCYQHKMTTPKHDIDKDIAMRIISEAYDLGVREVGFSKSGEPFLNPDLDEYINRAATTGYEYIYLTTNGIRANVDRVKSAVQAGLNSIKFSINAINAEEYRFIHGSSVNDFQIAYQNLKDAYAYRKESGMKFKIFVSYVETKYTMHKREAIYQMFSPYCDEVLIVAAWNLGGYNPEVRTELSTQEMDVDYDSSRHVPCPVPFNALTITSDGYLSGCCVECQNFLAVADLHNMTLKEAWESDIFKSFRKRHMERDIRGLACENCISNAMIKPQPLNYELASDFDEDIMFSGKQVKERVEFFLNLKR